MVNWPKVVETAKIVMQSDKTSPTFLNATTQMATMDERLSACFQAVCHAMGNVHRAKVIQNFAAAAFHLCYLFQVCVLYCSVLYYSF